MNMTNEEFEEIIKPLWLLNNKVHREFMIESITDNFNKWKKSKVENISQNSLLSDSSDQS